MKTNAPLEALHAESPLRVWSLIVTIFGDLVMQQGTQQNPAPVWSGAILQLLQLLRIDAGLARTSLSRLVANKTLVRIKSGRNTFYQLASESRNAFKLAAQRIYSNEVLKPTGHFDLVVIDHCSDRQKAREDLLAQGYRFIGPTVAIKPNHVGQASMVLPLHAISSTADDSQTLSSAARSVWKIEALNAGYTQFLKIFPLEMRAASLSPEDAIVTRVLLVHQFRRLVLRDPGLPFTGLPLDWKGTEARQRFAANLVSVSSASKRWVEETGFLSGKAFFEQE